MYPSPREVLKRGREKGGKTKGKLRFKRLKGYNICKQKNKCEVCRRSKYWHVMIRKIFGFSEEEGEKISFGTKVPYIYCRFLRQKPESSTGTISAGTPKIFWTVETHYPYTVKRVLKKAHELPVNFSQVPKGEICSGPISSGEKM
jgi:hypothetical protein